MARNPSAKGSTSRPGAALQTKKTKDEVVSEKRPAAKSIGSTLKTGKDIVTPDKSSNKSSKIKVTRKKTIRTKSEAKEAKISARQTVRKTNKKSRQDMRKTNRAEPNAAKRADNRVANAKKNEKARIAMRQEKKAIRKTVKKK